MEVCCNTFVTSNRMKANSATSTVGDSSRSKVVRRGSVSVSITPCPVSKNGKVFPRWFVIYFEGGKRVRRSISDFDKALTEAEFVAARLAAGDIEAAGMTATDRTAHTQALRLIKDVGRDDLVGFVREATESIRLLPPGVRLRDAIQNYLTRTASLRDRKPIPDLVAEFLSSKTKAGLSDRHLSDMRHRLTAFSKAFACPADELTCPLLQRYLDTLNGAGRTKLNHWRHIITLLRWGVRRKLAPRDLLEELEAIERPRPDEGEIGIFTPAELLEMLEATCRFRPDLLAWVVIGAYCGLRTAELMRLDWAMVNAPRRFVEVSAAKSKTRSRRLVPLCDSALSWLAHVPKREGPVSPYAEENKALAAIVVSVNRLREASAKQHAQLTGKPVTKAPPFKWVKNGLRHSFCSYRLAQAKDAAKVALEAGNSPAMLFKHYRELVTEANAEAWFGLRSALT